MNATLEKPRVRLVMNENEMDALPNKEIVYKTSELNLWYGENHALKNIDLDIYENEVTAIIGPSG